MGAGRCAREGWRRLAAPSELRRRARRQHHRRIAEHHAGHALGHPRRQHRPQRAAPVLADQHEAAQPQRLHQLRQRLHVALDAVLVQRDPARQAEAEQVGRHAAQPRQARDHVAPQEAPRRVAVEQQHHRRVGLAVVDAVDLAAARQHARAPAQRQEGGQPRRQLGDVAHRPTAPQPPGDVKRAALALSDRRDRDRDRGRGRDRRPSRPSRRRHRRRRRRRRRCRPAGPRRTCRRR